MPATRSVARLDPGTVRSCRCGRPAAFRLVTTAEMGGRYRGSGKTRTNTAYRCPACARAAADKFGLTLPE